MSRTPAAASPPFPTSPLAKPLRSRSIRPRYQLEIGSVALDDVISQRFPPSWRHTERRHGVVPVALPDEVSIQLRGTLVAQCKVVHLCVSIAAPALRVP